jgi:hypothetical protein
MPRAPPTPTKYRQEDWLTSAVPGISLYSKRIFDASVDQIWQTWTDQEHFKDWYGPREPPSKWRRWTYEVGLY